MGATLDLVVLAVIMFVLSFVLGLIPLKCNVRSNHMNYIATAGAGLLLGTAFIVILPEGIEMLMEGFEQKLARGKHKVEQARPFDGAFLGLAIVLGIIFMLFVERIGVGHSHVHGHQQSPSVEQATSCGIRLTEVEELRPRTGASVEHQGLSSSVSSSPCGRLNLYSNTGVSRNPQQAGALTLGLVIHAAIDGIALGTVTAGGGSAKLSLVVFGALMGHKVPASFSLTAILVAQGVKPRLVVRNLLFFCAAAPIGALVTYFILDAGLSSISENAGTALGYCMLFSGGTFIGVIFEHILPELKGLDGKLTWLQLLIFTIGALVPISIPGDDHH